MSRWRSLKTGKYVSEYYAKRHPKNVRQELTDEEAIELANRVVHEYREEQRLLGNPTYTREGRLPAPTPEEVRQRRESRRAENARQAEC